MKLWDIIKRLHPLLRNQYRLVALSILLTIAGAFLAQVNPLIVQYAVNQIQNLLYLENPLASGYTILVFISTVLLSKELANIVVQFGLRFIGEYLKVDTAKKLSNYSVEHLLTLSPSFFAKKENQSGLLAKRIERSTEGLSKTVKNLFIDILPLFANSIVALIIMYRASIWVGIASSVILPIFFFLSIKQAQLQKGVRIGIQDDREKITNRLIGMINSIIIIKSFVRESFESTRFSDINNEWATKEVNHHRVNHIFDSLKIFSEQIGVVAIVIITSFLVLNGTMGIGAIMLHLLLYNNITSPIRHLHRIYDEFNEVLAYAGSFFAFLDSEERLPSAGTQTSVPNMQWEIEFDQVDFSYIPGQEVIHEVSLKVPQGKKTALVGLSGAGKTTIATLMARFYDASEGIISIGQRPIKDYDLDFLRTKIGLVLQQSHVFSGTVAENIRYGKLDATEEQIAEAAKKAHLHQAIIKRQDGYATDVGELSGGERQRVALARVFLKDPAIVILDEPTASLDAHAKEQIKDALDILKANRTVLIISHDMSQIIDADIIYVIKDGRVDDHGTHQELYSRKGHYSDIIDSNVRSMKVSELAGSLIPTTTNIGK